MMNTAIFSKLHVRRRGLRLLLTGLLMCVVPVFGVARANAVSITQYPLPNSLSLESPDFISAQPSGVFTAGATASSAFARLQPTPTGVTLLAGPPGPRAQRGMTAGPDGSLWYLSSQVISNRNYEAIVQATATGTAVRAVYPNAERTGRHGARLRRRAVADRRRDRRDRSLRPRRRDHQFPGASRPALPHRRPRRSAVVHRELAGDRARRQRRRTERIRAAAGHGSVRHRAGARRRARSRHRRPARSAG